MEIQINRIIEQFDLISTIGLTEDGGITRLTLSLDDKKARDLFALWMEEEGLEVRVDDIGNTYGRREGKNPNAKPIVMGSHLDSIENSGKYDGAVGLLSALEVVRILNENSIVTDNPIEIVNFTNEEGVRFAPLMAGSAVLSNDFEIEEIYKEKDKDGKTFLDELKTIGYLGQKSNRLTEAEAYIELHTEQGPILFEEEIPIGVVEGILGLTWLEVKVKGRSDNSGPTPMRVRKDALCTAANMVLNIEKLAGEIGENSITTVGKFNVFPNSVNMVPGEVQFSVDIRDIDKKRKNIGVKLVMDEIEKIAVKDGMEVEISETWNVDPVVFSKEIRHEISKAAATLNYPQRDVVSGAGHMTTYTNKVCPTGMIFIPSIEGKSHCPDEKTEWEDIRKGANVLLEVVKNMSK